MKLSRLNWMTGMVLVTMFAIAAWYMPQLPDPVPTHWNAAGEVDGWTPKPWGVWLLPVISMATFVVLLVLPVISPKGFRLEQSRKAYDVVIFVVVCFMALTEVFSFRSAVSGGQELMQFVPVAIGMLFLVLGNYLGKFQKNFFVGIRTPWTLASDEVWNRTHRLGGYVFMAGGAVIIVTGLLGLGVEWFVATAILVALIPTVYSLLLYRRLEGFDDNDKP
ncbi:MAG: SdpI family protein [Gammaproteobacteria bacterium]|nr:SdpI family protein [Gammaproteobacteria bacterium]